MKIPILITFWFLFIQPIALKGMDANPLRSEDFFPLIQLQNAIEAGDTQTIAFYLAQGGDVERKIKPKRAPLLVHACRHNNPEICKLLLDAHANPNSTDKKGEMPLMCVSDEKTCKMLLDAKAMVNANDAYGNTPLMLASNEYICKMLLEAGADVNAKNTSNETALFFCKSNEECRLLLQAGADVNVRNTIGETALFKCDAAAEEDSKAETDKVLERYRLLVDARADVNARCDWGHTILIQEIQNRNERICEFFLSRGASVHIKTNDGLTPLLAAAKSRNKAICKMLVNHHKELDRGLIAALHCIKHIKDPFLRFLYSERKTLLCPHLQHGTLARLLMQSNEHGKCAHDLFHLKCLIPTMLQFSNEDTADDSDDGIKNPSGNNAVFGLCDPVSDLRELEKIWHWNFYDAPNGFSYDHSASDEEI